MMTALSTARPAYGLEGPSAGRTVDNAIPQGSTYRRGNFVQSNGAGSEYLMKEERVIFLAAFLVFLIALALSLIHI